MDADEAQRIGEDTASQALYRVMDRCGEQRRSLGREEFSDIVAQVVTEWRAEISAIFGEQYGQAAGRLLSGALVVSSNALNSAAKFIEDEWTQGWASSAPSAERATGSTSQPAP